MGEGGLEMFKRLLYLERLEEMPNPPVPLEEYLQENPQEFRQHLNRMWDLFTYDPEVLRERATVADLANGLEGEWGPLHRLLLLVHLESECRAVEAAFAPQKGVE